MRWLLLGERCPFTVPNVRQLAVPLGWGRRLLTLTMVDLRLMFWSASRLLGICLWILLFPAMVELTMLMVVLTGMF